MQAHCNVPIASKNPYAQRRTAGESVIQTPKPNLNINLLADSTNVATKSSVSRSKSTTKLPENCPNIDYDFDDDAMIDEYMEYDNDKPPDEYDAYMEEAFENMIPSEQAITSENTASNAEHSRVLPTTIESVQQPTNHADTIVREEQVRNESKVDTVEAVIPSRNRPRNDLYKFERYMFLFVDSGFVKHY